MRCSKRRRIAFLLGSGVSFPAGMPSTSCITERILTGRNVRRAANRFYQSGEPLYAYIGQGDEYVPRIVTLLNKIKTEIDRYYADEPDRSTNYEDLYYVVSQIHDSEVREYDNPAVQSFIDRIWPEIETLLTGKENETIQKWELWELADEATRYIRWVVRLMLSKPTNRLDHLACIKDACLDAQFSNLDIFTLNHDTLLEQYLMQNGVKVDDGFGEAVNNVRYWDSRLLESESNKVRLFKLHGSLDWFQLVTFIGEFGFGSIGIPLGRDISRTKSPEGHPQILRDPCPMLLAGTFNKMLDYMRGIFVYLHYQFFRSLQQVQELILSGYGFRDKGINERITEWIDSSPRHRILLVDPKPAEELKQSARPMISKRWNKLEEQNRLVVFCKGIGDISWDAIRDWLFAETAEEKS